MVVILPISISLNNSNGPSVVATVTDVLCNGTKSGTITITGANGSNPIIGYVVEGAEVGTMVAGAPVTISNLEAGTYNIKNW